LSVFQSLRRPWDKKSFFAYVDRSAFWELCGDEVTDVLALANLLANNPGAIGLGDTSERLKINTNGKRLMYGYSHVGCAAYRAVEQGPPVRSFSVIEGFTDFRREQSARHSPSPVAGAGPAAFLRRLSRHKPHQRRPGESRRSSTRSTPRRRR
jgi:hypothetical protein